MIKEQEIFLLNKGDMLVEYIFDKKVDRDIDASILKIIAAFFVVLIHAAGNEGAYALALNGFARFSVPIFMMLSGRYILARQRSLAYLIKKSLRLFVVMLIWSAVFYLYYSHQGNTPKASIVSYLLAGPAHLWYVWAAIALYFLSPFLYVFCENAPKHIYKYALVCSFVLGTIIFVLLRAQLSQSLTAIIDRAKLPYQLGFVFCFLYGDYCRRYNFRMPMAVSLAVFLFSGAATAISALYLPEEIALSFFYPSAITSAIGLYGLFAHREYAVKEKAQRVINWVGECTLGVYLIHPLFEKLCQTIVPDYALLSLPLIAVMIFVLSLAAVMLIRIIPILKRLI